MKIEYGHLDCVGELQPGDAFQSYGKLFVKVVPGRNYNVVQVAGEGDVNIGSFYDSFGVTKINNLVMRWLKMEPVIVQPVDKFPIGTLVTEFGKIYLIVRKDQVLSFETWTITSFDVFVRPSKSVHCAKYLFYRDAYQAVNVRLPENVDWE